jgi:hypothetical protein
MLAGPGDLRDYRAFRLAAREGPRLAAAQRYLRKHPDGTWVSEVRRVFDEEEPSWFESAQSSREKARQYLVDLPQGPHAEAALQLMLLFDAHQEDTDTLILLANARHTAATLDHETERRKHLSEVILDEVAALLDKDTWGASVDDPPRLLDGVLRAGPLRTWGGQPRPRRVDQIFFVIPTPHDSQPREVDVGFDLDLDAKDGRVIGGHIRGDDLIVRWAEALLIRVLDPTEDADRTQAAAAVVDVLSGALEGTMPLARCSAVTQEATAEAVLLARACDGWSARVTMGARGGAEDVIDVRGPR